MTYTPKMKKSIAAHGFTRRTYEFTAMVISKMPPKLRATVADHFVENLEGTPGFDAVRFLKACGI